MRIAHFIQRYPPARGGSEAYFARLSRFLAHAGDDVTVFTSNALALEAFWPRRGETTPAGVTREDGVEVRRYPLVTWPLRRLTLKPLSLFPHRLWQCLTMPCNPISLDLWRDAGQLEAAFDVVHGAAFPYAWPLVCARRLARRLRVPFVLTPFLHLGDHDDPRDPVRRAYTAAPLRWLLREADLVLAQTESEWNEAVALGVPRHKVVLQGLGVEPAECTGGDRERTRQKWNVADDEIVVGHLANQSREKGTVDLLQAVELLWRRGIPVRVVLAGPQMPNFTNFWREFDAWVEPGPKVIQLGAIDDETKKDFFAALDIFALPSRSDSFGLVLLEAWANGVPNVGYRAGGVADVICHGRDGWLAKCGDIDRLADALERLVANANLREVLGRRGRERVPRDFRWEEKLTIVRRAYATLLSPR